MLVIISTFSSKGFTWNSIQNGLDQLNLFFLVTAGIPILSPVFRDSVSAGYFTEAGLYHILHLTPCFKHLFKSLAHLRAPGNNPVPRKTLWRGEPCADLKYLFPGLLKQMTSNFCVSAFTPLMRQSGTRQDLFVEMLEWCCIPVLHSAGWESQEKTAGKLLNSSGNMRHKEFARATRICKVHACGWIFF